MIYLARVFNKLTIPRLQRLFQVFIIVVISITVFFYWWGGRQTEQALSEQMLHRQSVLVRSGARSIEEFFKARENDLLFLATLPSLADPYNQNIPLILKERLTRLQNPVVDIIRVDSQGEVVARASGVSGVNNVSDRDYFLWAKEPTYQGKVFYSQIVIARGGPLEGQPAFSLVTPVFNQEKFAGLLAIVISPVKLAQKYVSTLAVAEKSVSLLVLDDGTFIAPQLEQFEGKKIEELVDFNKSPQVVEKIKNNRDGKGAIVFKEPKLGQEVHLVAFTPVRLADEKISWSLLTTLPEDEALVFFGPFHLRQAGGIAFGLTALLLVVILFTFGLRLAQKEGFLDGFEKGRTHG